MKDLEARRFEWTAVHSTDFWKENALKFETGGDFHLLKSIAALLQDPSVDETTAAIALFDLGEFAVAHPSGRQVLTALGIRPLVMSMLKRDEDEIKQQALMACSKLMVTHWKFVSGSGAGASESGTGTPSAGAATGGGGRK